MQARDARARWTREGMRTPGAATGVLARSGRPSSFWPGVASPSGGLILSRAGSFCRTPTSDSCRLQHHKQTNALPESRDTVHAMLPPLKLKTRGVVSLSSFTSACGAYQEDRRDDDTRVEDSSSLVRLAVGMVLRRIDSSDRLTEFRAL